MNEKLTAEQFLRDKLENEVMLFGDGTTEFHTRDITHLLKCLYEKDNTIRALQDRAEQLTERINFKAEHLLKELLLDCMTINNLSAEQRLRYIRQHEPYTAAHKKLNNA